MLTTLFRLELKNAFRSPTWKQNLWMRILIVFAILYFALIFLSLGIGAYYIIEKLELGDPFEVINRYVLYYLGFDIVFRYMLQPMPVANVQPLLYQPVSKKTVVHFSLLKTLYSFFNWSHLLLLIPLSVVLIVEGGRFTSDSPLGSFNLSATVSQQLPQHTGQSEDRDFRCGRRHCFGGCHASVFRLF